MNRSSDQQGSRREFFSVARRFGLKAAAFACACGATAADPRLHDWILRDARAQSKAKHRLRFGASVITQKNEEHLRTGLYEFVRLVEQNTDGEVNIQIIDQSQACAEQSCGDRVANGVLELGSSSPQNLGSVFPYAIALDWPMLWKDRTGYHNLLFSSASNRLYRDVMKRAYGIVPLFGSGEMRDIMMGLKYSDRPPITSPAPLAGAKIRITNSEMIANFAASLKMNPIPLAWSELLEGLKSGVVDAAETWAGAATGFGMQSVLSQDVAVGFSPGFELVFVSARVFDRLPDKIKAVFLEAAWGAMQFAYKGVEEAQNRHIGNGPNPSAESVFAQSRIKHVRLSDQQRAEFRAVGGVEANARLYDAVRSKLDKIAGFDVYGAMKEFEASVAGKPLAPGKWWV